jgi:carbamoyltransferase
MEKNKDIWVAGITRGHNGGVCLLKNGEIVFSIEEERLTRYKYDGGPIASIQKILEYTDKLDYVGFAHTQALDGRNGPTNFLEWCGDNTYMGILRKLGLIKHEPENSRVPQLHSQVYDFAMEHHKLHAWCGLLRSGWKDATILVVDGAGTFIPLSKDGEQFVGYEIESVFKGDINSDGVIQTVFKHIGTRDPITGIIDNIDANVLSHIGEFEPNANFTSLLTDKAGTVKAYEAATKYCGWQSIEAGKTMGLFPYGSESSDIPSFYDKDFKEWPVTNRNWVVPKYPNGADLNDMYLDKTIINDEWEEDKHKYDYSSSQNVAYSVQTQTQQAVLDMILKSVEMTGNKNVVLTGGYGLNCVANYYFLNELNKHGIKLYAEPISNDAGTALGAAYWAYYMATGTVDNVTQTLYLGPSYCHSNDEIDSLAKKYNAKIREDVTDNDVIDLITNKNIVTLFQGRCENGPRALGNRSILYDPTDPNGKDFVNTVKHREYFRPFAGTILEEDVHEWFDLRGMDNTPYMMYAVNCQPGVEEKIPSIIHVDGTCRIQTITQEQNLNYYNLIKAFKERTGCPIIFNTSFNLGGEPLVETLDDGFRTLSNSDIEYMYLPEYKKLVYIPNQEK